MKIIPIQPEIDFQPITTVEQPSTHNTKQSRRTFGSKFPSRRTFGKQFPSRRTFGQKFPSRRGF